MSETRIEQARYITRVSDLEHPDGSFTRLYFGQEFCQRLMPSRADVQQAIDFAIQNNLDFTFLTPYVTDAALRKLVPLLDTVAEKKPGSEVIFNDWGVLRILGEKPGLEPVMGRLLNKMKRGPRIMNLLDAMPPTTADYFRGFSLDSPLFCRFLVERGVRRVELDNLLQGIDVTFGSPELRASLYTPYAYISTTRLCLANTCDVPGREDEVGIFPCKRECQKYTSHLSHPVMPVPLISKGNTVFYRNESLPPPEELEKKHIDRIVVEACVPI